MRVCVREGSDSQEITQPRERLKSDGYYVAYKPITLPCILFMFIEMNFYSLSFLCDVCNEVHEHMQ